MKGKPRCTLQVHPDDAVAARPRRRGAGVGHVAASDRSTAPVEVTDAIRPGVVSLPHGWGHDMPGTRLRVAAEHAGRELQRPVRRRRDRSAVGQRGAQRHPGRPSPPVPPEPDIPRSCRAFAAQGPKTSTQTGNGGRSVVVHIMFMLATGNSQGCPLSPHRVSFVGLAPGDCGMEHGQDGGHRNSFDHEIDDACLGSEPCTCVTVPQSAMYASLAPAPGQRHRCSLARRRAGRMSVSIHARSGRDKGVPHVDRIRAHAR